MMDGGAGSNQGGQARCVVWRAKGTPLPGPLANALTRPDFLVTECDNQFEAVARLCRAREPGGQTVLLLVEPKVLPAMSDVGDIIDRYAPETTLWVFESQPSPQIRAVTPADRAAWEREVPVAYAVGAETAPARRAGPVLNPATKRIADDAVSTSKVKMPAPPRLRLAGDGPSPAAQPAPAHVARELKVQPPTPPQPQAAPRETIPEGPGIPPVQSGKAGNLLSDEELEMLLAPDPGKEHY
jgi:hypothetical protein